MSRVAGCATLADATAQLAGTTRNSDATERVAEVTVPSLSGRELRAQLRAQLRRNMPATPVVIESPESCAHSEPGRRDATPAEATELRELIALVLANASDADRAEALTVAVADPAAALTSFRLLADEARNQAIWGPK